MIFPQKWGRPIRCASYWSVGFSFTLMYSITAPHAYSLVEFLLALTHKVAMPCRKVAMPCRKVAMPCRKVAMPCRLVGFFCPYTQGPHAGISRVVEHVVQQTCIFLTWPMGSHSWSIPGRLRLPEHVTDSDFLVLCHRHLLRA
ncbi:hypothetical protein BCR34DRAFT_91646 [Clohesyomyces aquaticus]|uniref:Uncharacterized protein n=1 Tax=Clohesyomyces aquaticus TaxID=1231657 RepID=A0A1Y1YU81_9PLEO|nr:hypothetical protein BCR34DRAFT_91646 [Clohesyomyces aquaticus]